MTYGRLSAWRYNCWMDPVAKTPPSTTHCACVHVQDGMFYCDRNCLACLGRGYRDFNRERTLKKNAERKLPSAEDYQNFGGAHCKIKYAALPEFWRCPGCNRTRFELLRWTMLYPNKPHKYMGWAAGIHEHHDHSTDSYGSNPAPTRPARFPPTMMCEQCNSADSTAKRKLKLPSNFTFTPAEIAQFVHATPHGWHLLNYPVAQRLFDAATVIPRPFFF